MGGSSSTINLIKQILKIVLNGHVARTVSLKQPSLRIGPIRTFFNAIQQKTSHASNIYELAVYWSLKH